MTSAAFSPDGLSNPHGIRRSDREDLGFNHRKATAGSASRRWSCLSCRIQPRWPRGADRLRTRKAKSGTPGSGQLICTFREPEAVMTAASFSPDGTRLVTTEAFRHIARVWDTTSGREVATLSGGGDTVSGMLLVQPRWIENRHRIRRRNRACVGTPCPLQSDSKLPASRCLVRLYRNWRAHTQPAQ